MLLPILRWITSDRPSMCALLSLGTFFLFCSFESVLFWKYHKRDTSGATLCYISNSNAVVSRHVEISTSGFFLHSLLFLKVWRWEILIYRAPAAKSNSQKTISWDYRYFRFAWCCKDSFFLQNQFSVDRSRVLQNLTCNLQPAKYTLRKKMRFQTWGFYHSRPLRDQFLPLTIPTMTTMFWIETYQPWARFVIHNQVIKVVQIVQLSKSTLSPDEDLQCAVETSRSISKWQSWDKR